MPADNAAAAEGTVAQQAAADAAQVVRGKPWLKRVVELADDARDHDRWAEHTMRHRLTG